LALSFLFFIELYAVISHSWLAFLAMHSRRIIPFDDSAFVRIATIALEKKFFSGAAA
jgi:hypothetical protein